MPIYEFYCSNCHMMLKFFSRRVNTEARPDCPRCGMASLERRLSLFAISKGRRDDAGENLPDIDDARLEQAFEAMAGEMQGLDEEDPKAAARMMRKLFSASGMRLGDGMEEALRRMESGDDPDAIEAELGDVLENEEPFSTRHKSGLQELRRRFLPPRVDDTLYEL